MRRLPRYRLLRPLSCLFLFGVLCLIAPRKSYAYLDPGTGSYVFQLALALVLGAAFTGKVYWRKIRDSVLKQTQQA